MGASKQQLLREFIIKWHRIPDESSYGIKTIHELGLAPRSRTVVGLISERLDRFVEGVHTPSLADCNDF